MDLRDFEVAAATALAAQLGAELERFSLRRDVAGVVDAVANVRGKARVPKFADIAQPSDFESIRAAGSRITVRLGADALSRVAAAVEQAHAANAYGGHHVEAQCILVDFCDPNVTKPLHLGHLRSVSIGAGLVRLLEFAGAQVVTQWVAGDIGRSVAEAMAGVELFGALVAKGGKTDHWVGACYARYVREAEAHVLDEGPSPDAPIARELQARGDRADILLSAWLRGDPVVRDTWKQLVEGVSAAHHQTLERLSVSIRRVLLESEGTWMTPAWISSALEAGVVVRRADGAVVFETDRESYPALLLIRPDGVPTEHMRALPLWSRLQEEGERYTRCFHVMGSEWLVTTELRESLVRKLTSAQLFERYVKVAHSFVTVAGSKMKSSDGRAVTIDEALDRLGEQDDVTEMVARAAGLWNRDNVAAALMGSTLLGVALPEVCEIDPDIFLTVRAHPVGWTILRAALAIAESRASAEFRPEVATDRYLVLQAARLSGFLSRASASGDLCELLRFVCRVARQVLNQRPQSRAATCAADWIVAHGLRVLGLRPPYRVPHEEVTRSDSSIARTSIQSWDCRYRAGRHGRGSNHR